MTASNGVPSEGVRLRAGWFGTEFVPFDEIVSLQGGVATLASGDTRALPPTLIPEAARALGPPVATGASADGDALSAYASGSWSPVRAARALLEMASAAGASDVHVEAVEAGYRARLRIAGELSDFATFSHPTGTRLVAALKHIAGCLPYRADIVQEGRVPRDGVTADVRASFLPTALGERVALRLFGRLLDLGHLRLDPGVRARFETVLESRAGLVLVAGPSGGGKTTTLYAALAWLAAHRGGAHMSLEDPVEQRLRLAGIPVDQVELCPERGLTAEVALVGALRQDVDVLAVGEVRTPGEAALALKAAHTGRLVLAGLHAGSAREAMQRMRDLEVDPTVLATTLRAVLHQRLTTVSDGDRRVRVPVAELWLAGEGA